jgi:CHAD domain-containing protein
MKTASTAFRGALRTRLDAFTRQLPAAASGEVTAIHKARVASRRLREALPIFAGRRRNARTLTREVRDVAKALRAVRELDVLAGLVEGLHRKRHSPTDGLRTLNNVVARARDEARERLRTTLTSDRLTRLTKRLERAAKAWDDVDPAKQRGVARTWHWVLEARLVHRAERLRSAIDAAGAMYVAAPLHQVRVALKKLRYALELSHDVGGNRLTAAVRRLEDAQDVLGQAHDLEGLLLWARRAQMSAAHGEFETWRDLAALSRGIENDCRRLHARYMRQRTFLIALTNQLRREADGTRPDVVTRSHAM